MTQLFDLIIRVMYRQTDYDHRSSSIYRSGPNNVISLHILRFGFDNEQAKYAALRFIIVVATPQSARWRSPVAAVRRYIGGQ